MCIGKHAAGRGEVSCSNELEIFEQQVHLAARDAVRKRLGSAQSGVAQGGSPSASAASTSCWSGGIRLEKAPLAGDRRRDSDGCSRPTSGLLSRSEAPAAAPRLGRCEPRVGEVQPLDQNAEEGTVELGAAADRGALQLGEWVRARCARFSSSDRGAALVPLGEER